MVLTLFLAEGDIFNRKERAIGEPDEISEVLMCLYNMACSMLPVSLVSLVNLSAHDVTLDILTIQPVFPWSWRSLNLVFWPALSIFIICLGLIFETMKKSARLSGIEDIDRYAVLPFVIGASLSLLIAISSPIFSSFFHRPELPQLS